MSDLNADADELSPELEREQLALFAENFHRFVLEAIPRLEHDFQQDTLVEMLSLAQHYSQAFEQYSQHDDPLAWQYLQTARRLVTTICRLLGKPEDKL
ncbi:MAG: hypothetical protein CVV27_13550 [Candidatus Melainabacteria bacterium HGW-Melainabacteria-1]|nr:MAG: hypothetical protein CVV27_13550 [Candidatus Melainabacteria bacterium HGW-Melainabacteria-1]